MEQSAKTRRPRARVASSIRGRVRIKVDRPFRHTALFDQVKQRLEEHAGVGSVSVNPATGSVTIPYDHARLDREEILGLLSDLDVIVSETVHPTPSATGESAQPGGSRSLVSAVDDLNGRIRSAIGVPIDFKALLPLGLAGAGVWSISRHGLMIESVPGWFLLWLGLDTYVKLHPERSTTASTVGSDV
ncbi:HMA2 domain-containing protein [Paraburkholderia youngii]|uniref:HMA2 domain-containing protein n=1 Tax=Paraburkholderia youngii TaxID=2782701 RepID=UPI003D1C7145